jgi:hypothetical protein
MKAQTASVGNRQGIGVGKSESQGHGGRDETIVPSPGFVVAVSGLLETDAADLLAEMGYGDAPEGRTPDGRRPRQPG